MLVVSAGVARAGGGCHDPGQTEDRVSSVGDTVEIDYKGMCTYPNIFHVPVGATVTWRNTDPLEHTVTSGNGWWADKTLSQGDTFEHTFTKAGLYPFYCMIHPNMGGVIDVGGTTPLAVSAPDVPAKTESSAGLAGATGAAGLLGGAVLGLVWRRKRNGSSGEQA
jgi:plastocyanin